MLVWVVESNLKPVLSLVPAKSAVEDKIKYANYMKLIRSLNCRLYQHCYA